jgi:putative NADPH-quinone reductase
MKTVVVFSHPYKGSFNKAILEKVKSKLKASELAVIDLYEEGFDPVMNADDLKLYS